MQRVTGAALACLALVSFAAVPATVTPATSPLAPPRVLSSFGSAPGGNGSWASVAPAGDLDGDGFEDVTAWHVGERRSVALSGRDGRAIAVPATPAHAAVAWSATGVDLDGRGGADVLRVAVANHALESTCDQLGRCQGRERWTWEVSVHASTDASASWTWRTAGAVSWSDNEGSAVGLVERTRTWTGEDDLLRVHVVEGPRPSLLVQIASTDGRTDAGMGPATARPWPGQQPEVRTTIRASSLTALDESGAVIGAQALPPTPWPAAPVKLGDLDGDGRGEVALARPAADGSVDGVDVLQHDLSSGWSADGDVRLVRADDQAGRSRVAVLAPGYVDMRDGASGAAVWRSSTPMIAGRTVTGRFQVAAYYLSAIGGGGQETTSWFVQLDAVDQATGATGQTLAHVKLGSFEQSEWPGSFVGVDVDGDDRLDMVGQARREDATGGVLLTVTQGGIAARAPSPGHARVRGALDLDSTRGHEVVWDVYSELSQDWDDVLATRPGQRLWQVDRSDFGRRAAILGDGITHWAQAGLDDQGRPVARLLDGANLTSRWVVPLG